jgi:hypothetical protein
MVDWANSQGCEINTVKQIHIELIQEEILCQKGKHQAPLEYHTASVSVAVNFNQTSAYFWISPNIDLEERLLEIKEELE